MFIFTVETSSSYFINLCDSCRAEINIPIPYNFLNLMQNREAIQPVGKSWVDLQIGVLVHALLAHYLHS